MVKLCSLIAASSNTSAPIWYLCIQVTETNVSDALQNISICSFKICSLTCAIKLLLYIIAYQELIPHNTTVHVCSILKQQHCHQNKCKFFFEYDNTVAVSQSKTVLCKYDVTKLSPNEQSLHRNYFRSGIPCERNKFHSVHHCSSLDPLRCLCIFV